MILSFKYRVKTNRALEEKFLRTLDLCRELYNAGLKERRDAWNRNRIPITFSQQCAQLPEIKELRPELKTDVHSQVLQSVLRQLDRAFASFFRRVQEGVHRVGYPRFKSATRFNSFLYSQSGWKLDGDRLHLSKIGTLKLFLSRPVEGRVKTVRIKREAGLWYAIFACEVPTVALPPTGRVAAFDLNLCNLLTDQAGKEVMNPQFFREMQERIAHHQKHLSRKKKGSTNYRRQARKVRNLYRKLFNRRQDYLHKLSTRLVNASDVLVFERLRIAQMVKNRHLSKAILDTAWGILLRLVTYKAEKAGRMIVLVNPHATTQLCSNPSCGRKVKKGLSERAHRCPHCGLVLARDHNAALNILARGMETIWQAAGQGSLPTQSRCAVSTASGEERLLSSVKDEPLPCAGSI